MECDAYAPQEGWVRTGPKVADMRCPAWMAKQDGPRVVRGRSV